MKRGEVANFIEKLDQILETPQFQNIVCWTPEGDAFIIKSVTKLTDVVLPKYFKHHNYSSFNRQLNMYNFVKIRCETDEIVYRNPHFLRYDKQQYKQIKRRAKGDNDEENGVLTSYNQVHGVLRELRQIGRRQYRLQNTCKSIFTENQMIINENAKLWKRINQKLDRKNKQLTALLCLLLLGTDNKQLLHSLPLMEAQQNVCQDSENNNSDSSDDDEVIQHNNLPRNLNKQLMGLLQNKNLNIQDLLGYLSDEKLKQKHQNTPLFFQKNQAPIDEPNLYIKEHGESSSSQKEPSQRENEKENSIISDVNYFLNKSTDEIKDLSDYGVDTD